jgi:hypothetical protein
MKKLAATSIQVLLALLGAGALALLLWEPHLEGRNAHATTFEIYFNDPFLAFAYLASLPFFIGLYQAFKVAGTLRQNRLFSAATVKALGIVKLCAGLTLGFVVVGELILLANENEDRAGGVFMGLLVAIGSLVAAATAAKLQRVVDPSAKKR